MSTISSTDLTDDYEFTGHFLKKRYFVLYKIGAGSFASIWLSYDIKNKKYCAIKLFAEDKDDDAEFEIETFKQIKKVNSIYFINMKEHFEYESDDETHKCIVLELMAGNVFDLLNTEKYDNGLPFDVANDIMNQISKGLYIMHSKLKLVHADLKPENILIKGRSKMVNDLINLFEKSSLFGKLHKKVRDTDYCQDKLENIFENIDKDDYEENNLNHIDLKKITVVLSDFGTSFTIKEGCNKVVQTRQYRAPEVNLLLKFNHKIDVWSMGCIYFELLTGDILFNVEKKRRFNKTRSQFDLIEKHIGLLPDIMKNNSPRKILFFKTNGLLKGRKEYSFKPMNQIIKEKCNLSDDKLTKVYEYLDKSLRILPTERLEIKDLFELTRSTIVRRT